MKNFLALAFVLLLSFQMYGQAKENGVKLNPLGLIFGSVNVQYERALSESSSAQLGVSVISLSLFDTKLSGFGISPEYRYYPSADKEALDGFYVAPVIGFNKLTLKNDEVDSEASLTTFGGGAKIGWNWLLGASDSFIIDLGLGAQYLGGSVDVKAGSEGDFNYSAFDGIRPILNFGLGYAF